MRLSERIDKKTKGKLNKMRKEKLSKFDIDGLMDVNKQTLRKKRGRWRSN